MEQKWPLVSHFESDIIGTITTSFSIPQNPIYESNVMSLCLLFYVKHFQEVDTPKTNNGIHYKIQFLYANGKFLLKPLYVDYG